MHEGEAVGSSADADVSVDVKVKQCVKNKHGVVVNANCGLRIIDGVARLQDV